jgi:hypothetical protein
MLNSVPSSAIHLKKYRNENKLFYLVNALAFGYIVLHKPNWKNYSLTNKFTPREKQVFIGAGITISSLILFLPHSTKHLKNAALAYNDAVMKR